MDWTCKQRKNGIVDRQCGSIRGTGTVGLHVCFNSQTCRICKVPCREEGESGEVGDGLG